MNVTILIGFQKTEVQKRHQKKVEKKWEEAERKRLDSHHGMDAKVNQLEIIEEMEKQRRFWTFSPKRRRDAVNPSEHQSVTTPPLTPEQYAGMKNWNVAAQVGVYGFTTGLGVIMGFWLGGAIPGGAFAGAVIGAAAGAMWGAYEANCIASVQDEFDKAYANGSGVEITRNGLSYEIYGGGDTYSVANAPLSVAYVAATALILTGQIP